MKTNNQIPGHPFYISNDTEFNAKSIEIFQYQYSCNPVYKKYVDTLKIDVKKITSYEDIPFLPIQFFKTHNVSCEENICEVVFMSSGTGGNRSIHNVKDLGLYESSFTKSFQQFFGNPKEYIIIALLPNYIEQGESSLVYMVNKLITLSNNNKSGFFLDDTKNLIEKIQQFEKEKKVLLVGVSYALLDLAEKTNVKLSNTEILETGGMKGRRKELVREELHEILKNSFGVNYVCSEYGMTELLSQGYLMEKGRFETPPWMKIMLRDINDPLSFKKEGRGGVNVIDLANINSCSFIATQDLGRVYKNGSFDILGRFDNTDIRGCNLLIV